MFKLQTTKFITYGFEFNRDKFKNAIGRRHSGCMQNKPTGGLWGSPIDSEWGWKDWCKSEGFNPKDWTSSFTFTLDDKAKILVIDSAEDFINALKAHGVLVNDFNKKLVLDFDKLITEYDGLFLTKKGCEECRYSEPTSVYSDLYSWDCESIVMFNLDHIIVQER